MTPIFISIGFIVLGFLLVKIYSTLHITWPLDEIGFICQIFGITALVIALISIPIHRIGVNGDIEKYKDVVQSVEEAKKANKNSFDSEKFRVPKKSTKNNEN
jgi:hypothetical protein